MQATSGSLGGTHSKTKPRKTTSIFDIRPGEKQKEELDLALFLEEQSEAAVGVGVGAQTEAFLDLPADRPYVPKKTGVDASTQMDPEEDDALFDFDTEVEPILDVLVGKILDQSLMEVEQEVELKALAGRKSSLYAAKTQEVAAFRSAESVEVDKAQERRRIVDQRREFLRRQRTAVQKAASLQVGVEKAGSIVTDALAFLQSSGHFRDPVKDAVEASFLPDVYHRVQIRLSSVHTTHSLVDDLLAFTLHRSGDMVEERLRQEAAEREAERRRLEEEEKKKFMRIFVRLSLEAEGIETMIGPVVVRRDDTIGAAEAAIQRWLVDNPKEETASLMDGRSSKLRLCIEGQPLDLARSLWSSVNSGLPLELLPIGDGEGVDGSDKEE